MDQQPEVPIELTLTSLMGRPIEADGCAWFSRTKAMDSREYSPAGSWRRLRSERDEEKV